MKNFSRLVPHLPQPATPHAEDCLSKIKAMLAKAPAEKEQPEREPGSDDEEVV